MVDLKIYAIGDKNEKGKALEQQFGYVLNHLGYTNLRFNIHKIGEEIDVKGHSKLFNEPLIAECKAHSSEITTPDVRKFFSSFQTAHDKEPKTHGIYLSISGYNSTAEEWYEENIIPEKKEIFKLLKGVDFIDILKQESLLISADHLESIISSVTSLKIEKYELLISDRGLYWKINTFSKQSDNKYIFFLDAQGNQPLKTDIVYLLSRIELSNDEKILNIKDRHTLLVILYDNNEHNIDSLIEKTKQSKNDIQLIIDELHAEGLIQVNHENIKLRKGFPWFNFVFKECNEISKLEVVKLMVSEYFSISINDIINQTALRYKLDLNYSKEIISTILRISPLCVEYCLFGDDEIYINAYNQVIKDKRPSDEVIQRFHKTQYQTLIKELIMLLLFDCFQSHIDKNLLIKQGINTIFTKIFLKLGSEKGLKAAIEAQIPLFLLRAAPGSAIKKGEWVSASNINSILDIGNRFLGIEEYDYAIGEYKKVIESDEEIPKIHAIINRSCTYIRMGNYKKADESLDDLEKDKILFEKIKNDQVLFDAYLNNKKEIKKGLDNELAHDMEQDTREGEN